MASRAPVEEATYRVSVSCGSSPAAQADTNFKVQTRGREACDNSPAPRVARPLGSAMGLSGATPVRIVEGERRGHIDPLPTRKGGRMAAEQNDLRPQGHKKASNIPRS
jgi:hypothetical protein